MYLYLAVDSGGATLEFLLSETRDAAGRQTVFLQSPQHVARGQLPRVITVDKNPSYPKALTALEEEGSVPPQSELRQVKYPNNLVEQDHRFIKRLVKPGLGFFSYETARRALQGYAP